MKPALPILAFTLLTSFSAAAQRHTIGIQAGAGLSRVRSDVFENEGAPKARMNLGLTYERRIGSHLTLGADLLYQQRGFTTQVVIVDQSRMPIGTTTTPFSYNYAALPVKAGYQFGAKGYGFGKLGLVPALLLRASYERPEITSDKRENVDMTGDTRRFSLAGIAEAGGGYRFDGPFQLYASLAFQHDITSFTDAAYFRSRHYGCYLNLGFRYELGARKAAPQAGAEG